MAKQVKKLDEINQLASSDLKKREGSKSTSSNKVIGVRIKPENGSASVSGYDKIYYYKSDDPNIVVGQEMKIWVPTGGRPDVVVVSVEEKNKKGLKELRKAPVYPKGE